VKIDYLHCFVREFAYTSYGCLMPQHFLSKISQLCLAGLFYLINVNRVYFATDKNSGFSALNITGYVDNSHPFLVGFVFLCKCRHVSASSVVIFRLKSL
jgi:hypothetical protein